MPMPPDDPDYWERRLASEGLPATPKQLKPIPRRDRSWTDHFNSAEAARSDAIERMRIDMQSTQDLFSMLADIRWGRHDPSLPPLTKREHAVFDRYCDGWTEAAIAAHLGVSQTTVGVRLRKIIARFTTVRPRLARGVRGQKRAGKLCT